MVHRGHWKFEKKTMMKGPYKAEVSKEVPKSKRKKNILINISLEFKEK